LSNRKNQNSILVLATLGVYLGLVLAGATPQVLAQAAMTRQFDVKDEIEFKDDLDNKPDKLDEDELRTRVQELKTIYLWYNDYSIEEYADLVDDVLRAYSDSLAFDVRWDSVGDLKQTRTANITSTFAGAYEFAKNNEYEVLDLGNGLPGKSFSFSALKYESGYSFKFTSLSFAHDAPLVRYLYSAALDFHRSRGTSDIILAHTEIKVEGTNLIISTRLPRGSLDSLLAKSAQ
jgi:hypothetical protein